MATVFFTPQLQRFTTTPQVQTDAATLRALAYYVHEMGGGEPEPASAPLSESAEASAASAGAEAP